jgi:predicted nucleotidyltransferase
MSLERSDLEQAKIRKVDPELAGLLNQARDDPEAIALVLFGSAASGPTDEGSDLDVWSVRRGEPLPPRERRGRLEIVPTTLDHLRAAPDWLKSALAYAQIIWDETGEVESVLPAARTISHDETAELYDGYLNDSTDR